MIALLFAALLSLPTPQARPPVEHVIGPQDVLTITVVGQDAHSGDVVVRPDGKISLSLVDEVQAAGLTPLQLKDVLTKAHARFFKDPTILIALKQINGHRVFISGLVEKPGDYRLEKPMDILQLIAKAGGLLAQADRENIRLLRKHPDGKVEEIVFNYTKLFERYGEVRIPQLRPGDQVIVK